MERNLESELKRCIKSMKSGYMPKKDAQRNRETLTLILEWMLNPEPKMKPVFTSDGYEDGNPVYDVAECPRCGYIFEDTDKVWGEPFCPHCGARLMWDEVM